MGRNHLVCSVHLPPTAQATYGPATSSETADGSGHEDREAHKDREAIPKSFLVIFVCFVIFVSAAVARLSHIGSPGR